MRIEVEALLDEGGVEKLRRFYLAGRKIEVAENIDQWHGAGYRYFKVRGGDGDVYILYRNDIAAEWGLTMYRRSRA